MATPNAAEGWSVLVPYEADSTVAASVRKRFWYSGGPTIDQGQTSVVVGVVWTHWLAARQVPPTAGDYDFRYALDLFHATQREAEMPEDDQAGAQLLDSVKVMFSRELITACARCQTVEDVTNALLGHGPVIAGITWRSAMFEPDRSYGHPICRVDVDSPVAGGHAVLFDGIDLDLELGGVTGFIRFKNSWGPAWGDGGSCLISIADVDQLISRSGEEDFLLPTPAAGPPEPPVDPDGVLFRTPAGAAAPQPTAPPPPSPTTSGSVRSRSKRRTSPKQKAPAAPPTPPPTAAATPLTAQPPPEPTPAVAYEKQPIGSDRYTISDNIGYSSYANAIAQGIQHPDTHPPLSIGIKAPWGAGKTSLMRMVRHRLEWPDSWDRTAADAEPTRIPLTGSSKPVTYWSLLRQVTGHRAKTVEQTPDQPTVAATIRSRADQQMNSSWRPTVWFNPWMYQTGEQIWAGFAQEIIRQITERLHPRDRERFWLSLNLSRVDEQAVRRRVYSLVIDRLLPWLLGAVLLTCAGIVAYVAGASAWLAGLVTLTGPALAAVNVVRTLSRTVSGSLRGILEPAGAATSMAKQGWHGTFDELVPDPAYASRAGSFPLTRNDIQEVINLVATDERPLVIFIDDLDRCQPGTVLQVLEAINLFLANQLDHAIFVIAVEPAMVAAHIEVSYGALVANLDSVTGSRREGDTLGWNFLEKFIQLPLSLPPLEPTTTQRLVRTLFGSATPPRPEDAAAKTRSDEAEYDAAFRAARQIYATQQTLEGSAHIASAVDSDSASGEAATAVTVEKLSDDSPDMREVIAYGTKHLRGNPREVKRYVNVFRFLVMIAGARKLQVNNELAVLAKLAVLSTRWPSLHSYLMMPVKAGVRGTVFDMLEAPDPGSAKTEAGRATAETKRLIVSLETCGFSERIVNRLLDDDLRRFMRTEPLVGAFAGEWL